MSFSTQQVADLFRVSTDTIKRLTDDGQMTTIDGRYPEATVRDFMAANTVR